MFSKTISVKKSKQLVVGISVALFALWIGLGALSIRRAHKGSNDFDTYYMAGRAVLEGKAIYGGGEGHLIEGKHGPFLYSPFAACFFALFALLPLGVAAFLWHTLLFSAFLLIPIILSRIYQKPLNGIARDSSLWDMLLFAVLFLCIALDNLVMAQINALVFALTLLGMNTYLNQEPRKAGLFFGLSLLLKPVSILLFFYFLLRRQWKLLISASVMVLAGVVLAPTLFWGHQKTIENHELWFKRLLQPMFSEKHEKYPEPHLLNFVPWAADYTQEEFVEIRAREVNRKNRMDSLLNAKNQSLDATLTRWLLKDRNLYAESTNYPIWTARDYKALPVIGGGVDENRLLNSYKWISIFFLILCGLFAVGKADTRRFMKIDCLSLFLLTTILISPYVRSHQFIVWLLPLVGVLFDAPVSKQKLWFFRIASIFYFLQAIPYAKAVGVGTVASLLILTSIILNLLQKRKQIREYTYA